MKNPQRAEQLARQALQADPSSGEARYYLGLALFDLGRRDEAIRELEQIVKSGAKRPERTAASARCTSTPDGWMTRWRR